MFFPWTDMPFTHLFVFLCLQVSPDVGRQAFPSLGFVYRILFVVDVWLEVLGWTGLPRKSTFRDLRIIISMGCT